MKVTEVVDVKKCIEWAINDMNNNKYVCNVIYKHGKGGMVQKAFEIAFLTACQIFYPQYMFYHPNDHLGMSDVYSDLLNGGIEVKFTLGWSSKGKKDVQIIWENGTVQKSIENFLFVKGSIESGQCIIENSWIGTFSYKEWKYKKKSKKLYISRNTVREKCSQII